MKTKLKQLICSILVALFIFNYIPPIVLADDDPMAQVEGADTSAIQMENEKFSASSINFGNVVDGVVGVLTWPLRILILILGTVADALMSSVAQLSGGNLQGSVSPGDILFNEIPLVDINFFKLDNSNTPIMQIRRQVAAWYYALRNLAVVILLCVLIYVGIRMAISTAASDKAIYKKMITDWLVSFALVFVLHYIIILTINVNEGLVNIFYNAAGGESQDAYVSQLKQAGLSPMANKGWGATLVYIGMIGITFAFLIMYIKRMLTIGFLILISPVITVTYSIDKMNDGQAQALNNWLKEFMYNVLIQPFHCLIYLVFMGTALKLINGSLASFVLAIICMAFIWQAENIIREIFGFKKASTLQTGMAAAGLAYGGYKAVTSIAKGAGKTVGGGSGGSGGSGGAGGSGGSGGGSGVKMRDPNSLSGRVIAKVDNARQALKQDKANISQAFSSSKVGQTLQNIENGNGIGHYAIKGVKGGGKAFGKAFRYVNKNPLGKATGIMGAAMAATDDKGLSDIPGAYLAASAGGTAINNAVKGRIQGMAEQGRQQNFAKAYDDYANATGYTDSQIYNESNKILGMDQTQLNNITDPATKQFAEEIKEMEGHYKKSGASNSGAAVLDTIKSIQKQRNANPPPNP